MKLKILYEDNHIIVVRKPRGILSQAGDKYLPDMLSIIKDYLKQKYKKPGNVYLGLVHRLDLNVSGVMVFAKTSKAASRLSKQIREHEFVKKYLAIIKGSLDQEHGILEDYIIKDQNNRQAVLGNENNGKLARLKYQLIDEAIINSEEYSLLDIELLTGRFHQIRFQFANLGHPLLGDTKYGLMIKNNDFFIGLYAYQIEFNHPTKKEKLVFNLKPTHKNFIIFKKLNNIKWR